jgi:long-chain acyl-CoA synthetase
MAAVKTIKPNFFGKGSVEIGPEPPAGEGRIRRLAISADKLVTQPFEGINTTVDVITYAARTHGSKNALGWREVVDIHEEEKEVKKMVDGKEVVEKKKWKYFQLSEYKYISFAEVEVAVSELARALVHIGLGSDAIFNIYSQTRCVFDFSVDPIMT